jgi:hypothetical protein
VRRSRLPQRGLRLDRRDDRIPRQDLVEGH